MLRHDWRSQLPVLSIFDHGMHYLRLLRVIDRRITKASETIRWLLTLQLSEAVQKCWSVCEVLQSRFSHFVVHICFQEIWVLYLKTSKKTTVWTTSVGYNLLDLHGKVLYFRLSDWAYKGSVVILSKIEAFFWMPKPLFYLRFWSLLAGIANSWIRP